MHRLGTGALGADSPADTAARMLTEQVFRPDDVVFGQQPQQAFGDQFVAGRRPMRAEAIGIGFGVVEGDEWNSFGLQVLKQFVVAPLQADHQPGAMGFDEFTDLAD
jgi:hypothetical protein